MSTPRIFIKSLMCNWVGYLANAIVALLLSRYVVQKLGGELYGVWGLIVSTTGYLSLAELGTRGGIGRFVNYYIGKNREGMLSGVISSALGIFVSSAVVLFPAALILGFTFSSTFGIPERVSQATIVNAMLLGTLNLWLGFLCSPFTQLITARHRFDIYNAINLLAVGVRAFGTMIALSRGGGLVSLAAVQVASSAMALILSFLISRELHPTLEIRPKHISRIRLREMFGFSIWSFLSSTGSKLLHHTDILVIGIMFANIDSEHSASWWIPYYAFPVLLVTYSRELLSHVANVLMPHAVQLCGADNKLALREVLRWGGKFTMLIALPYYAALALFGPRFLQLFYDSVYQGDHPEMIDTSRRVLYLLIIPQVTLMAIRPGASIINGLGHVRFGALMTLGQGVINLALSIALVGTFGMKLEGIAWGTLVPMVICNVFICLFLLDKIQYRTLRYIRENALPFLSAAGVMLILMALSSSLNIGQYADAITQDPKWMPVVALLLDGAAFMLVALPASWFFVFLPSERVVAKDYIFLRNKIKEAEYEESGARKL
ncbi:MAG: oligosaccharide flippase family protein [Phycisphaerales bacterium]|jgi:O-antigen/teichoic acid export membrane protein|nr:oligosaccharide flippase family protein [Phycisphaerales bacterium]MBT7170558.1 oligosaccharide flippase family protein [Phycisphaerales bacterium]